MGRTRVFTDKLQHMAGQFQNLGLPTDELTPVDINGGFVAVDKWNPDNLRNTQHNIQWKTALTPNGGNDTGMQPFETPRDRYTGITQAKFAKEVSE